METNDLKNAAHILAMLALQSDRYRDDPEYREATDNVLHFTQPHMRKV